MKATFLFGIHPKPRFIPYLELLESRLQPGEAILGFSLFSLSLGDLGQSLGTIWGKPDVFLAGVSPPSRQLVLNEQAFIESSIAEPELQNQTPSLLFSERTENSQLLSTSTSDEGMQNFATQLVFSLPPSSLTARPEIRSSSPIQSRGPDWLENPGALNLNEPILTTPQNQVARSTVLPQISPIDRASIQTDAPGITRRLTTHASHLPNLHVTHVSKPANSQIGIQSATLEFLTTFAEPGMASGKGIVVDEKGNSYVTGYYDTQDPKQGTDVFVAKLDPTGENLLWFTGFGGPGRDEGHGISRDQKGNLYVVGTIDTGDHERGTDAFVAKLDPDGNFLYEPLLIGRPGYDQGNGITVNQAGEAYITGTFIARIRADGSDVIYAFADGGYRGNGIGVDAKGNIYLATGPNMARIAKYNAEQPGELPQYAWGYIAGDAANAIVVAPDGTYYWAGEQRSGPYQVNALIGKGGPGGIPDIVYVSSIYGHLDARGFGVAYDAAGYGYVSGTQLTSAGMIAKLSPDGRRTVDYLEFGSGYIIGFGMTLDNSKPNPSAFVTGILATREHPDEVPAFIAKVNFN
jgi:hypothetical protein